MGIENLKLPVFWNMHRRMNTENLFLTVIVFQVIFNILRDVFLTDTLVCMYMPLLIFEQIDLHEG